MRGGRPIKKLAAAVLIVAAFLGACTQVPVEEVMACSKVVKVELVKDYFVWVLSGPSRPSQPVYLRLTLDDGTRESKSFSNTGYEERYNRFKADGGKIAFSKYVKIMEMGREYCRTEYKPIGK